MLRSTRDLTALPVRIQTFCDARAAELQPAAPATPREQICHPQGTANANAAAKHCAQQSPVLNSSTHHCQCSSSTSSPFANCDPPFPARQPTNSFLPILGDPSFSFRHAATSDSSACDSPLPPDATSPSPSISHSTSSCSLHQSPSLQSLGAASLAQSTTASPPLTPHALSSADTEYEMLKAMQHRNCIPPDCHCLLLLPNETYARLVADVAEPFHLSFLQSHVVTGFNEVAYVGSVVELASGALVPAVTQGDKVCALPVRVLDRTQCSGTSMLILEEPLPVFVIPPLLHDQVYNRHLSPDRGYKFSVFVNSHAAIDLTFRHTYCNVPQSFAAHRDTAVVSRCEYRDGALNATLRFFPKNCKGTKEQIADLGRHTQITVHGVPPQQVIHTPMPQPPRISHTTLPGGWTQLTCDFYHVKHFRMIGKDANRRYLNFEVWCLHWCNHRQQYRWIAGYAYRCFRFHSNARTIDDAVHELKGVRQGGYRAGKVRTKRQLVTQHTDWDEHTLKGDELAELTTFALG